MFFETSAKADTEIVKMFYDSATLIYKTHKEIKSLEDLKPIKIYQRKEKSKKSCC